MNIKLKIIFELNQLVNSKIKNAKHAILSAEESRDNETKSSAGDKYETGRAMMQIEIAKNKLQLNQALVLKNQISQLDISKFYTKVEVGSFITTNHGDYFIGIGLGKLKIKDKMIYAISINSPIGQLFLGKETNDSININSKIITILNVS